MHSFLSQELVALIGIDSRSLCARHVHSCPATSRFNCPEVFSYRRVPNEDTGMILPVLLRLQIVERHVS